MIIRVLLIAGLAVVAGCAHRDPPLPVCDGSSRRPANPYGSVLIDGSVTSVAPTSGGESLPSGGCA